MWSAWVLLSVLIVGALCVEDCPFAPSIAIDRRPDKSVLKIVTYNGEWLFLNGRTCPGTGCPWNNQSVAELHLLKIVEVLLNLNADIINIVEINDCLVLKQMALMLNSKGMNYQPYLLSGTDTATSQNVGLLTRVDPITNLQRSTNRGEYPMPGNACGTSSSTGTSAVSKHYFTTFKLENMKKPLTVFGLHFLAFPITPDRCRQREAQASVIQGLAATFMEQGHSLVIMGDLNDYDNEVLDLAGSVPTSRVLKFLKDPVSSQEGDELFNVASFIDSRSQRYSSWYDQHNNCLVKNDSLTTIDHILLSNDLRQHVKKAFYDHAYPAGCNIIESDHYPVVVELEFPREDHKDGETAFDKFFWTICVLMVLSLGFLGVFAIRRLVIERQNADGTLVENVPEAAQLL